MATRHADEVAGGRTAAGRLRGEVEPPGAGNAAPRAQAATPSEKPARLAEPVCGASPQEEEAARPRGRRPGGAGHGRRDDSHPETVAEAPEARGLPEGSAGRERLEAGFAAMSAPLRYCGRDFSQAELEVIRGLAATLPTRRAIADAACEALLWYRRDGRLKDMSARVALLRMAADGLLTLPAPRNANGNGRLVRRMEPVGEPPAALAVSLAELGRIELVLVDSPAASRRWRTLIATHHYLGYTPFAGAQLRYLVESPRGTLAALGFAASAWKCAARDEHIGWDACAREARLHLVVGNARFLILPHVRVDNLASWILSRAARRVRADWPAAYGYAPLLLETFVESGRFSGASYRAANWLCVGRTKGRGKLDRRHEKALPVKDVYLYPLRRDYRRLLSAPA